MSFRIRLAGRIIEVHPLYDGIRAMCDQYICPSGQTDKLDFTVTVTDEDIRCEDEAVRDDSRKTGIWRPCTQDELEISAVYRRIAEEMAAFDTFLMHGAVVATAGLGCMITAPSGVGKTTRLRLWTENIPDSFVVNGDKPLLRQEGSIFRAYGTPWCGKEGWNTDTSVPLQAVFLLSRSDSGRGNRVRKMTSAEAFPKLLHQAYLPEEAEARRRVLYLLRSLAGGVGVYDLYSEPTAEAVRMAWDTVRPRECNA